MTNDRKFVFEQREWNLLHNVLNEILYGFEMQDIDSTIGIKRPKLELLLEQLHHSPQENTQVELSMQQTKAFRNALVETLRELGRDEFQTRTGYSFDEGEQILKYLERITK